MFDDSSVGGPFEVTDGDYDYLPQSMFVSRSGEVGTGIKRIGIDRQLEGRTKPGIKIDRLVPLSSE